MDRPSLVTFNGSELGSSKCSSDGNMDGKSEGLLLGDLLGSVVRLEFERVIETTLGVLEVILLGTYFGIELGLP